MDGIAITDIDYSVASAKIASVNIEGVRIFNDVSPEKLLSLIKFWRQNEYLFLQNALTFDAIAMLRERITYEELIAVADPRQFYRVHNDEQCSPFINKALAASKSYYAAILSADMAPAYAFAMKYIKNSDMDPHYDNYNNPISSTICYHFTPEHLNNPIYVDRARFENPYTHRVTIKDRNGIPVENVAEMNLRAGDIAVFRGRNHLHWRNFVADEMDYRALLLHFYDYKYKGDLLNGSSQVPHIEATLIDFESYDDFRRRYAMYFDVAGQSWI